MNCSLHIAAFVLAFIGWGSAWAKGKVPVTPSTLRGGQSISDLPVTWELLRSGFNTLDAALEAETFAEIWSIYQVSAYETYLITPRGRARLVTLTLHPDSAPQSYDTLALYESEFARVLGIDHNPLHSLDTMVLITLPEPDAEPQTIVLTASPQYFVSVSISFY